MLTLVAIDDPTLFGRLGALATTSSSTTSVADADADADVAIVDSTAANGVRTCGGARQLFTDARLFMALSSVPTKRDWRLSGSTPLVWRDAVYLHMPFEQRRVVTPLELCRVVDEIDACNVRVRWMSRRPDTVISSYDLVIAPHSVENFYLSAACAPACLNPEWGVAAAAAAMARLDAS